MREKISSIAILRCLGASHRQAFGVYLLQVAGIGLIGSVMVHCSASSFNRLSPLCSKILSRGDQYIYFLSSLGKGIALGLLVSVLFALLPLISIRKISPALTLRLSVEVRKRKMDFIQLSVYSIIFLLLRASHAGRSGTG